MKNILEKIVEDKSYEDIPGWHLPNISKFSEGKVLFEYQVNAIKNITKVLNEYFLDDQGKKRFHDEYKKFGLEDNKYSIYQKENKRFHLFQNHFETMIQNGEEEYISGMNFLNRACLWMATGSGKSLVIIKTIELLDYLQSENLIPEKEILLLMPREFLIEQFKEEVKEYNEFNEKGINLVNLKDFDEDSQKFDFSSDIKVFYHRSDLLRTENKENIVDYRSYENSGNWYVLLDEAHRGEKANSLMQDYISILSKNGFLFNFSATFTDSIDYLATCFNFNLKRFIENGYGKNIYFSKSYFSFKDKKDDLTKREKQRQVLKSLILFSVIKSSKKSNSESYHWPLLMTLVNSVNTKDSDLKIFFEKIGEISTKKLESKIFDEAKLELIKDFNEHSSFVFGEENIEIESSLIKKVTLKDIFKNIFNSENYGKIEIIEGEKGREIALKLETSDKPFGLIKIGDTGKFKNRHLGTDYKDISSYDSSRNYFRDLDESNDINIILGSRSFYEGWDSDRPNILNLINIGGKDAKKFVLQSTGRGIRIQPSPGERKRLALNDKNKNQLLETLFMFASDKKTINAITETVGEQEDSEETTLSLPTNENISFDLLVPTFSENKLREEGSKFSISEDSLINLKTYINSYSLNTLIIKHGLSEDDAKYLNQKINSSEIFQIQNDIFYSSTRKLFMEIINHISIKSKKVDKLKELENEIQHNLQIKLIDQTNNDIEKFKKIIKKVSEYKDINKNEIAKMIDDGAISASEGFKMLDQSGTKSETFKDEIILENISQHYYLPLIYSEVEKTKIIKNIINIKSEVNFIKNLNNFLDTSPPTSEWMFSKLNENLDGIYIPYFDRGLNKYRKFYPDFIFWIKNKNSYKVVFIDPKGTSQSDYISKVEYFEKLFYTNGKSNLFDFKNIKVSFDLYLITDDINNVPEKYQSYWLNANDFSFLSSVS